MHKLDLVGENPGLTPNLEHGTLELKIVVDFR